MVLQDEFKNNGYTNLIGNLDGSAATNTEISLDDIYDTNNKPNELLGIFISKQKDELFFLLDACHKNINELCKAWDDRIRVFTIINGKNKDIRKLKFNIVLIIIYSDGFPNKKCERDLQITRKIILRGEFESNGVILVDDEDIIELPFFMIPSEELKHDQKYISELERLIPQDEVLLSLLKNKRKKVKNNEKNGVSDKSFELKEFEKIREWLEV